MIRMQGVVKTYPGRGGQAPQRVLQGVDLRVRPGEYVAFVGASGSGKSTLMHILGCLDTPTGGRYLLDGEDVSRLDAKALCRVRREKIGFVFQGYQLLSKLTAADNVAFPLMLRGVPEAERARRAAEALAQIKHSIRTRPTRTPSERAKSSPRHRSRILLEQASETETPSRMIAPGSHSRRMSVLDSPPAEK